ncbi:G5 domain-containing protein [Candidatus Saccharibacteria bacterium]|nr:G5 domain-containing protein [Candidatus Saccharibacteria bacterium]
MRTVLNSKKSLYLLSAFLLGLILSFSFYSFSKRTFAETEDSLEESETYAFVPEEKFITVFDGSSKRTVRSSASTVGDLLDRLNVVLSETDSVSPSLETGIDADNFFINIYRSRPVLILDGAVSKIVNVSSFDPKTVVRSAGFTVYDEDRVETVSAANFLEAGVSSALKIIRGEGKTVTLEEDLPFETKTVKSYDIPEGSEKVESLGELGKIRRVFRIKSIDGQEVEKELISEETLRAPVDRVVAVGAPKLSQNPLTPSMGRNRYTTTNLSGTTVERQETFYDLPMSVVMSYCGKSSYTVREDGAKVDEDGYVLVAANLSRYPRCSIVETSLGPGKVYDTGGFASSNPEQFDLATDWTNHDGR